MNIDHFNAIVDAAAKGFDRGSEWACGLDDEPLARRVADSVEDDVEA